MGGEAHNETEIHPQDLVFLPAVRSGGVHAERLCRAGRDGLLLSGDGGILHHRHHPAVPGSGKRQPGQRQAQLLRPLRGADAQLHGPGLGGIHLLGAGLARPAGLRIPEGQTHSAAAAAGGRGRGAPSALCSADGLRRHGGPELLGEPALGAAGLRPRLGRTEPV